MKWVFFPFCEAINETKEQQATWLHIEMGESTGIIPEAIPLMCNVQDHGYNDCCTGC